MSQIQDKLIEINKRLTELEAKFKERYKLLLQKIINAEDYEKEEMYRNELHELKDIIGMLARAKLSIETMAQLNMIDKDELINTKDILREISPELALELFELIG